MDLLEMSFVAWGLALVGAGGAALVVQGVDAVLRHWLETPE
ncbi:MAG TPA: hypothetical protein RMH80_01155 [Polyangiaceae bacterium LLY-WYZ-15_(1-7)]|nr:hypothetical protein [Polyangiaceae bacterium LLY-WYZ-15_(1-7)]